MSNLNEPYQQAFVTIKQKKSNILTKYKERNFSNKTVPVKLETIQVVDKNCHQNEYSSDEGLIELNSMNKTEFFEIGLNKKHEPLKFNKENITSWKCPNLIVQQRRKSEIDNQIQVQGLNPIPYICYFENMKLPSFILSYLFSKKIKLPTPIQMHGLPIVLSGRDLVGVASTGSGKTLVFTLPLVLFALEAEMRLSFVSGEGPFGIILCPARELARQTFNIIEEITQFGHSNNLPTIRNLLCIGGTSIVDQISLIQKGVHIIVGTPGRLKDLLDKKVISLNNCRFICLDEADRMLDMGLEDDVKSILSLIHANSNNSKQTLLFSATIPHKIQNFANNNLTEPLILKIGRSGSASINIIQHIEYVAKNMKKSVLLECLKKTAPPVVIFAENRSDVDEIYEHLLLAGVDVVATHGSKDQNERDYAIRTFLSGKADVLGLDFPHIQHVINYEMTKEIDDYVHRIGRTGRGGNKGFSEFGILRGMATTFVNQTSSKELLLDLKHLLIEAKQQVPPFLDILSTEVGVECQLCCGLGHRMDNCPKLEQNSIKLTKRINDNAIAKDIGF